VRAAWKPIRWLPDSIVAVLTTAGVLIGTLSVPRHGVVLRPLDLLGYALLVGPGMLLLVRRRLPTLVLAVCVVCSLAYYIRAYPGIFSPAPALIASYTVISLGRMRLAVTGASVLGLGFLVIGVLLTGRLLGAVDGFLWITGWLVALLVLGEVNRQRRAYLAEVERRALDAERTREEVALRRAHEERLSIARELHDSLTNVISVINVQANVALHLLHRRPEQIEKALTAIQHASVDAMRELRVTLSVLRETDGSTSPDLEHIGTLIERAQRAGITIRYDLAGDGRPLNADVTQAAYRIIQEGLNNVARHARAHSVALSVHFDDDDLRISLVDDGQGLQGKDFSEGYGIRGMRERVTALGGTLTTGPEPDGGFGVRAGLPYRGASHQLEEAS
jgi:signal transduction histidine kinase